MLWQPVPLAWIPDRAVLLFAWQVFVSILKHGMVPCTAEELGVLQERCRDPAVSVRKQALLSITELLLVRLRPWRGHLGQGMDKIKRVKMGIY